MLELKHVGLLRKLGSTGLIFLSKKSERWWETFHELVNHGNLDRNEGKIKIPQTEIPTERTLAIQMTASKKE